MRDEPRKFDPSELEVMREGCAVCHRKPMPPTEIPLGAQGWVQDEKLGWLCDEDAYLVAEAGDEDA